MLVQFEVGTTGAKKAAKRQDVCVVIDILRASSTIIASLQNGVNELFLLKKIPDRKIKNKITCIAEKRGANVKGTLDNSPSQFSKINMPKKIAMYSTNGIPCIYHAAKSNYSSHSTVIFVGAINNASAVAKAAYTVAQKYKKNISLILAGRNNVLESDDLFAGLIIYQKIIKNEQLNLNAKAIKNILFSTSTANRLIQEGKKMDVVYAAKMDISNIIPFYDFNSSSIKRYKPGCVLLSL